MRARLNDLLDRISEGLMHIRRSSGDADGNSPITRWDVIRAYAFLLDREPENEAIIQARLAAGQTVRELRADILISPEFRLYNPTVFPYSYLRNIVIKEIAPQLRLFVDLSDVIGLNITLGCYEPEELAFVQQAVKPGQVALDIGANIGFFAVNMAALVGPTGAVYAFEPFQQNSDLLERSIAENRLEKIVFLERAAVSHSSGSAKLAFKRLERRARNSGGAFLLGEGQEIGDGIEVKQVATIALDEYVLRRPVSFIKIDVEGAEPLALRGAERLLQTDRPVILAEINPSAFASVSSCTPDEFLAEMRTRHYECFTLEGGRPGSPVTSYTGADVINVLFCPEKSRLA